MKALSLKLDDNIALALDQECYLYGHKRNRYINRAVNEQILRDEEERRRAYDLSVGITPHFGEKEDAEKYILSHLTDENKRFLKRIHSQMGVELFHAISLGLLKLQNDYNERPFNYLPME